MIGTTIIQLYGTDFEVPYVYHNQITEDYRYITTDVKKSGCDIFMDINTRNIVATYSEDIDFKFNLKHMLLKILSWFIEVFVDLKIYITKNLTAYERNRKRKVVLNNLLENTFPTSEVKEE